MLNVEIISKIFITSMWIFLTFESLEFLVNANITLMYEEPAKKDGWWMDGIVIKDARIFKGIKPLSMKVDTENKYFMT